MERIGEAVRGELGRFGSTGSMADLVAAWPRVVGETVAANAWPARIGRDGTLHVAASSSVWAFELGQLESEILPRLREALGEAVPKRLRFAPGPLPEAEATAAERRKPPPLAPSAEHVREARSWAAAIESEELRKTVEKTARANLARADSGRSVW
jgi:hypothetical protein